MKSSFSFQWEGQWTFSPCMACNPTSASNKQTQEHKNLVIVHREKLKEPMSALRASNW